MADSGKTLEDFAKRVGITRDHARTWLMDNNARAVLSILVQNRPTVRKLSDETRDRAALYLKLKTEETSDSAIAEGFGITKQALSQWKVRHRSLLNKLKEEQCLEEKLLSRPLLPYSRPS